VIPKTDIQSQAEARMAVFERIESWYHPGRRHSASDYLSPVNFEGRIALRQPT
jgi:transposase InsO family protein